MKTQDLILLGAVAVGGFLLWQHLSSSSSTVTVAPSPSPQPAPGTTSASQPTSVSTVASTTPTVNASTAPATTGIPAALQSQLRLPEALIAAPQPAAGKLSALFDTIRFTVYGRSR